MIKLMSLIKKEFAILEGGYGAWANIIIQSPFLSNMTGEKDMRKWMETFLTQ